MIRPAIRQAIRPAGCRSGRSAHGGFSLVEIALVLVIVGILLGAALVPLASRDAERRERVAQAQLSAIRDALIAYLITHDRLPCPLVPARQAIDEQKCAGFRGGVPAVPLALVGAIDAGGALLDPWGRPYRFALSDADDSTHGTIGVPDWTGAGEGATVGIERLRGSLSLCERSTPVCPRASLRASDLVFVVLSHGADGTDADAQRQNLAERGSFTLAPRSQASPNRFDDVLIWASRSELVWWLLRAARLP